MIKSSIVCHVMSLLLQISLWRKKGGNEKEKEAEEANYFNEKNVYV